MKKLLLILGLFLGAISPALADGNTHVDLSGGFVSAKQPDFAQNQVLYNADAKLTQGFKGKLSKFVVYGEVGGLYTNTLQGAAYSPAGYLITNPGTRFTTSNFTYNVGIQYNLSSSTWIQGGYGTQLEDYTGLYQGLHVGNGYQITAGTRLF